MTTALASAVPDPPLRKLTKGLPPITSSGVRITDLAPIVCNATPTGARRQRRQTVFVRPPSRSTSAPCNNLAFRRQDERREIRNVVRFAESHDVRPAGQLGGGGLHVAAVVGGCGLELAAQTIGADETGVDRVDLYSVADADVGERLGKRQAGAVDRAADRKLGTWGAAPDADNVEHRTPPCLEVRPRRAHQPHRAEELEREPVGPIGLAQL